MVKTLGFIGLGKLGLPIAQSLMDGGFSLCVYNRTPEKAAPLVAKGATAVGYPAETAAAGGLVVSIVADDRAVLEVASEDSAKPWGPALIFQ